MASVKVQKEERKDGLTLWRVISKEADETVWLRLYCDPHMAVAFAEGFALGRGIDFEGIDQ